MSKCVGDSNLSAALELTGAKLSLLSAFVKGRQGGPKITISQWSETLRRSCLKLDRHFVRLCVRCEIGHLSGRSGDANSESATWNVRAENNDSHHFSGEACPTQSLAPKKENHPLQWENHPSMLSV
jgi:hypothetical protein